MTGTRRDNPDGHLPSAGNYGRDANGDWFGMTPNGHLANLSGHDITEHEDGTITASPSILVSLPTVPETWTYTDDALQVGVRGDKLWHGFLERGIWRGL